MPQKSLDVTQELLLELTKVISETNGLTLNDTLELLIHNPHLDKDCKSKKIITEFHKLLGEFRNDQVAIDTLLNHPFSKALFLYFQNFPLKYHEEHIHLTGSLNAEFLFPKIQEALQSEHSEKLKEKIVEIYGEDALPIKSVEDVDRLIRLQDGERFLTYLKILFLPKIILKDKKAHEECAYHMAKELYENYNVGSIRLKFTLSRSSKNSSDQIPGLGDVSEEDVVLGLFEGFSKFKTQNPDFNFILSPCFRKELDFFDGDNFKTKKDHFLHQVDIILNLIKKHPQLKDHLIEVDTVGDEKELYRKVHFEQLKEGLRKLQYKGFHIRSHHGETWKNLRKGIQSVDNAMNIWHIDTLEHGLSLGINPNYYFHRLFQRVTEMNEKELALIPGTGEYSEIEDMEWLDHHVKVKILDGEKLTDDEKVSFLKTKFHTAREIEHYQHDVLNRMINKNVSLVALPTSNMKLTESFPDYKDHPFSWWEKKNVNLGVGTDNYITLSTNFIQEMLILLYSDPENLKITKLLMVVTKESRRPHMSHILWKHRKNLISKLK
ncbi:MAG: hypothetical protein ACPGJV_15135 [Bacteriovoracaceae bacterium]